MARRKRMHGKKRHPSAFKFGMISSALMRSVSDRALKIARERRDKLKEGRKDNIEGNINPIEDAKEENL